MRQIHNHKNLKVQVSKDVFVLLVLSSVCGGGSYGCLICLHYMQSDHYQKNSFHFWG